MSVVISPSILSCDFLNIERDLKTFDGFEDLWFHLDVMDGHFVPNLTFGHPILTKIPSVTDHKLDAHFMVTNPEFYIDTLKEVPLHNFTFHLEATNEAHRLLEKVKSYFPSAGITIKPGTPASALDDDILKLADLILVMSVEPGFGGQSFIESSYDKIDELKSRREKLNTNFVIQVDGGVKDTNAKKLIEAGADNLVAGSYIFKAPSNQYRDKVESLRKF